MRTTSKLLASIAALVLGGVIAPASAQVTIPIPSTTGFQLSGDVLFDTYIDPTIDVTTGRLLPLNVGENIEVVAFGEVFRITDSLDATNEVYLPATSKELTFSYTGAIVQATTPPTVSWSFNGAADLASATRVTYSITSQVVGGTFRLWADNTRNFNGAAYKNAVYTPGPSAIPSTATDGVLWLEFSTPESTESSIVITFVRPDVNSNFTSYELDVQTFNGGNQPFALTGGQLLDEHPELVGQSVLASQLGEFTRQIVNQTITYSAAYTGTLLLPDFVELSVGEPYLRNAPVNRLVYGAFQSELSIIPEPASLGLLAAGGLLLLARRRRQA